LRYAVGSVDGATLGELVTDPRRRIERAGVFNLRDVGGYPVDGGGTVRWRTLFRSDALHRLDPGGVAELAGLGLRTVIDLRTQPEADVARSPVGGRVIHVPVVTDLQDLPLDLRGLYRHFLEEGGAQIAAAVAELCGDGAMPALVHCTAGKDRTGVVIALVLAVLGAPDEVIAADYALSAGFLEPGHTPVVGELRASTGLDGELIGALLGSPPELIVDVLDMVRERAGSVDGYLRGHGLAAAALDRLRAALIV
jgi:protein-tyrosine phosphatase